MPRQLVVRYEITSHSPQVTLETADLKFFALTVGLLDKYGFPTPLAEARFGRTPCAWSTIECVTEWPLYAKGLGHTDEDRKGPRGWVKGKIILLPKYVAGQFCEELGREWDPERDDT